MPARLPQQRSETISVGDMNRRACLGACAKRWWSEFPVVKRHDIGRKRNRTLVSASETGTIVKIPLHRTSL